jgi:hypothetical protein
VQSEVVQPGTHRDVVLFWIASAILILNLLDGVFTLTAVHAGAATEVNPLMATSLGWGGVWFMLLKIALVSLCVLLLWRARHRLLATCGLVGLCLVYAGVVAYHASALDVIASHVI